MGTFTFPRPEKNYWRCTKGAARKAIEYFTPQMYVLCMGTGKSIRHSRSVEKREG